MIALIGLSVIIGKWFIGTEYIPNIDGGDLITVIQLPEGYSAAKQKSCCKIEKFIESNVPEIVFGFTVGTN